MDFLKLVTKSSTFTFRIPYCSGNTTQMNHQCDLNMLDHVNSCIYVIKLKSCLFLLSVQAQCSK